jgi:F-type H+-transporting ATPase subunit c
MFNLINVLAEDPSGMKWIAVGLMAIALAASGIMEGAICTKTVDGMARNPEAASKLQSAMIIGCALTETTAIYGLVIAMLLIFVA